MMNLADWWPVVTVSVVVVTVVGKVIIVCWSLRDTKPEDRPAIIAALADLFRPWRRPPAQ